MFRSLLHPFLVVVAFQIHSMCFAQQSILNNLDPGLVRGLPSESGATSTYINFVNLFWEPVDITWFNYSGGPIHYATLQPFQSYTQQTYVTHPWVASGVYSGDVAGYLPEPQTAFAFIYQAPGVAAAANLPPHFKSPFTPAQKAFYTSFATAASIFFEEASIVQPECLILCVALSKYYDALGLSIEAKDPLDPNYTNLASPIAPYMPTLTKPAGLSEAAFADLNRLLQIGGTLLSTANAIQVSLDRADSAHAAGQESFVDLQHAKARTLADLWGSQALTFSSALRDLEKSMPGLGAADLAAKLDAENPAAVPEPSTISLFLGGVLVFAIRMIRTRQLRPQTRF